MKEHEYNCDNCGYYTEDPEEVLRWFRVMKYPKLKLFCSSDCLRNGVYPE